MSKFAKKKDGILANSQYEKDSESDDDDGEDLYPSMSKKELKTFKTPKSLV